MNLIRARPVFLVYRNTQQNLTGERIMIEHFIQSFGNFSIGQTVIVISAIVFLVKVYKKVTTYISKKALDEKEKTTRSRSLSIRQSSIRYGISRVSTYGKI